MVKAVQDDISSKIVRVWLRNAVCILYLLEQQTYIIYKHFTAFHRFAKQIQTIVPNSEAEWEETSK